jgi:coenzyme F420 hydrogenase subunit beta
MNVLGSIELITDVFEKNLCIGCGACVSLCPYFKSYNGKTAMLFPCTQPQGRCFAYCPKVEVDLDEVSRHMFGASYSAEPIGIFRAVKMARAGKKAGEGLFQAGGTVSALIMYALKKKKIDAAILTGRDGLLAVPAIVTDPSDVTKFATSKYTSAPTLAAFNQAVHDGYVKIGVVATPCQALALAQMRCNPLQEKDFRDATALVVGLFCTWALDYRRLLSLLAGRVDVRTIKKFDIPPPPSDIMEIITDQGKIEIPLRDIRESIPNSCDYCFDMTAEFADVSVGVLEGRTDRNTIIIRTERGEEMVNAAAKEGYLELEDYPEKNLAHLSIASGNKKKRALSKARNDEMINTHRNGRRALIRIGKDTLDRM